MRQLTEAEIAISARDLQRDTAALEALTGKNFNWTERMICSVAVGGVVFLSASWRELPLSARLVLVTCATALPYLIFEVMRLRKQVNALTQLVVHGKRGGV